MDTKSDIQWWRRITDDDPADNLVRCNMVLNIIILFRGVGLKIIYLVKNSYHCTEMNEFLLSLYP